MHAEHRHIESLADAIQHGLGQIVEAVAPEPVARERQNACLQRIPFRIGSKETNSSATNALST